MKRWKNFLFARRRDAACCVSTIFFFFLFSSFLLTTPAWAAPCNWGGAGGPVGVETGLGCIPTGPTDFVKWVLQWALGVGAGIAFLLFLYGGFVMMWPLGGGDPRNPDKLAEGREIIISAITGLLFIIFSVVLLEIIGYNILGIPGFAP